MPTKALIPIPSNLTPDIYTCFEIGLPLDAEWMAMFWGALDQLTRWNSYDRDVAHSAETLAATWKDIITAGRASDCPSPCPGFYIQVDDTHCPQNEDTRTTRVVDACDGCGSRERVHFSRSIRPNLIDDAVIGYSCFDYSDDTPCGGHFCQIRAFSTGIVVGPDWTLQWRDCLNVDHEYILNDVDEFVYNDFAAIWICLRCTDNFCATVSIDGPVLCGVS